MTDWIGSAVIALLVFCTALTMAGFPLVSLAILLAMPVFLAGVKVGSGFLPAPPSPSGGIIYVTKQAAQDYDSTGQAGALEDQITAILAAWDDPADCAMDLSSRELARQILEMVKDGVGNCTL